MARVNGAGWLKKWGNNLNGSGQYIKDGVARVQVAPGQSAAAAADRYISGVTSSVGRWQKNVSAVSLSDWQASVVNKGIPRIAAGVQQAQATKGAKIDAFLANVDSAAAQSNQLPKGGVEQGIARATAFMRSMSQLSGK